MKNPNYDRSGINAPLHYRRSRVMEKAGAGNLITGRKSLTRRKSITSALGTLTWLLFKQCHAPERRPVNHVFHNPYLDEAPGYAAK